MSHFRRREYTQAENLCRAALKRDPNHVRSLVLLGDIAQQDGRNKLAIKLLGQALELDSGDPAAHDTIAIAYQAIGRRDDAVEHFTQAMALGLRDAEILAKQSAAVTTALQRLARAWPRQIGLDELLGKQGASEIAQDALLLALLQSKVVHDLELERLLTAIRRGLLQRAAGHDPEGSDNLDGAALDFFCTLAQQCFLNEYIFAFSENERTQCEQICDRIACALHAGAEIAPLDLVAAASYLPLHKLPMAKLLLNRSWPQAMARLLTQQIREPLEEECDRKNIPALTAVDDPVSVLVQSQYEESPYPRWTTVGRIKPTTVVRYLWDVLGIAPMLWPRTRSGVDILIAGCGTGSHSVDSAIRFPYARILAIDISRSSLAYARRKSRALGLSNVTYGQADILKLGALDRDFDVVEAVGVLHHLSDPAVGWRCLLSLLRPNGLMLVGLYSVTARRSLAAARALIAERGYLATADDIRICRQDLITRNCVPPSADFSSISGCRDLLFNVVEHQFTIPQIRTFLDANGLTFLGFAQLPPEERQRFQQQFPGAAMNDLNFWHAYEQMYPLTFGRMYIFWVQKRD